MGGILYPSALRVALRRAVEEGIIVMAAAGQPLPLVVAPASFPECLAVAGTTIDDDPWKPSARGREVDFCAPAAGVWVAATSKHGGRVDYHEARHSGTSFSTGLCAGVAALWVAHHGRDAIVHAADGPEHVQSLFRSLAWKTARQPGGRWAEERWGGGILDAEQLLRHKLEHVDIPPPHEPPTDPADGAFEMAAASRRGRLQGVASPSLQKALVPLSESLRD